MRKISELAGLAFRHGKNFNRDNTRVEVRTTMAGTSTTMYLHGHMIAERQSHMHGSSSVAVTLAGWGTPTTRERVNGLLLTLGTMAGFHQSKHCQFFTDAENGEREVESSDWITTKTTC